MFIVPYLKLFVLEPYPHGFALYCICISVSDPDSLDPDPNTLLNPDPDKIFKGYRKVGNFFLIKNFQTVP